MKSKMKNKKNNSNNHNGRYSKEMKTKLIDLSANKLIVILDHTDARELGVKELDRVEVTNQSNKKKIIALVNVSKGQGIVKKNSIGVFKQVSVDLNLKKGQMVLVKPAEKPISLKFIKKKMRDDELTESEINSIVSDIASNSLSEIEVSAFVSAIYINDFTLQEIIAMTKAILNNGKKLNLRGKIVDKHSVGGINGRASMIITPIIAANGLMMPKTSSRAITSPGGTADAMEVLCNVSLNVNEIKKITKKVGAVIAWGGGVDLAPVDDEIIKIEHPLDLDPEGQVIASVMSKKASVGAKFLVIDIPLGPETKVHDEASAKDMALKFIEVGKQLGITVKAVVTDGTQPSGCAFGPALEAKLVLEILEGKKFDNLAEKSCLIAGNLLELAGKTKKGTGFEIAQKTIESGKALKKFLEIVVAQGGKKINSSQVKLGKFRKIINATENGLVNHMNIKLLRDLAVIAGCPIDKGAGIKLNVKQNDKIKKCMPLLIIYSENARKLELAIAFAEKNLENIIETEKVLVEEFN